MWWPFTVTIITIALDQWSKIATINASDNIPGTRLKVFNDYFYLADHRNTGAAWGMFSNNPVLLSMVSIVAALYFIWDFPALTENSKFRRFSWSLLIGGVLGNWVDRLFRREVIDMLGVNIPIPDFLTSLAQSIGINQNPYHFPIFNIADSAICVGVFLYFIHVAFFTPKKAKDENGNKTPEVENKEPEAENKADEAPHKKEAQV